MPSTNPESATTEQELIVTNVFGYARVFTISAIALNGGAALILLAVAGLSLSGSNDTSMLVTAKLPLAMSWFIYGVGYGGATAGFAYFAHVFFVRALWHDEDRTPATNNRFIKWLNTRSRPIGNICMGISVLAGISSYVCFVRAGLLISDTATLLYN